MGDEGTIQAAEEIQNMQNDLAKQGPLRNNIGPLRAIGNARELSFLPALMDEWRLGIWKVARISGCEVTGKKSH